MHFSQNVIFGVPAKYLKNRCSKLLIIYINKMCVLNELDFYLKAESFFKLEIQKKCIFFYRGSVTIHHMTKKNSSEKSFLAKHTSTPP